MNMPDLILISAVDEERDVDLESDWSAFVFRDGSVSSEGATS